MIYSPTTRRYEYWCVDCPSRIRIAHEGKIKSWEGNYPYPKCMVCGGALWRVKSLERGEAVPYNGVPFVLKERTPSEHARFIRVMAEQDDEEKS